MTVINASPVIHLHSVLPGGIAALPSLIGPVVVPFEVVAELEAGTDRDDASVALRCVEGITVRPRPVSLHLLLQTQIDTGEAAVIQIAMDEGADAVILDDRKARRVAREAGLRITGTLGILLIAKEAGLLPSVRDAASVLQQRGMFLEPALLKSVLSLAGESD